MSPVDTHSFYVALPLRQMHIRVRVKTNGAPCTYVLDVIGRTGVRRPYKTCRGNTRRRMFSSCVNKCVTKCISERCKHTYLQTIGMFSSCVNTCVNKCISDRCKHTYLQTIGMFSSCVNTCVNKCISDRCKHAYLKQ